MVRGMCAAMRLRSSFVSMEQEPSDFDPRSWKQPVKAPGSGLRLSLISEAVVQAMSSTLPELDRVGDEAKAAPAGRERHLVREPGGEPLESLLQGGPRAEDAALLRCPCPDLRLAGAPAGVGLGLFPRRPPDSAGS